MPCNYVVRCDVRIDLDKQGNRGRMIEAVKQLGYDILELYALHGRGSKVDIDEVFGFYVDGELARFYKDRVNLPEGKEYIVDKIKQKYSEIVIREKAEKFGWKVKTKGKNKFEVTKRKQGW